MVQGGVFSEYLDSLIRKPIIDSGGLFMALRIGTTIAKSMNNMKKVKDANQLEAMALYIQTFSYILAIIPFALSRPRVLNILIKMTKAFFGIYRTMSVKTISKAVISAIISICDKVVNKVSNNLILMMLMMIIVMPISALGLVISKGVSEAVIERNKSTEDSGFISNIINSFTITPDDVLGAFRLILIRFKRASVEVFPFIGKILDWVIKIISKLKTVSISIKSKIKGEISKSDDKTLQESTIGKFSLFAIIGGVIMIILKKSPIGALIGLFSIIGTKLTNSEMFNTGILGRIIRAFKSVGLAIMKKFNITELLAKGRQITKSLKTMDTVNNALKEVG